MIDTFVTFRVFPCRTGEFETIHRRLLALMCEVPGCVDVSVHRSMAEQREYMVHGRWETKEAWEGSSDELRVRGLFAQLPLEAHSLARASVFEPVYGFANGR